MSDKLLAQCTQQQSSELLQQQINSGELTLKNKNIVRILYILDNLFWRENQDIDLDFFECLLKNGIPLDSHHSEEHKTTAIEKIISSIENNGNAEQHAIDSIVKKYGYKEPPSDDDVSYLAKFQKYETILEKMLYLLVEYGANPNTIIDYARGCENISLLEYASVDKRLFKFLVEKGADINIQYISKSIGDLPQTPLSNAIDNQNVEIIKLLIEYNVEIDFWSYYALFQEFENYYLWNIVDNLKYNNLDSIKKSNISLINKLEAFENKAEKIKIERKFDELFEILKLLSKYELCFRHKSIFDLAIEAGDYKTIEFFLENKIDELEKVEMIDTDNKLENNSENLYDFASSMISHQDKRKLENLEENERLENNPYYKKYLKNKKDKPSVSKALKVKDIEQFKNELSKDIARFLPITDLIKEDYPLEFIKVAIDNGSDINFQDSNGKTALILACESNKIETVKYLLSKNIDLNIEDTNLKKAVQYLKNYELVKLFLKTLKNQHPKRLVELLKKFSSDEKLRYTNHPWTDTTYKNFYVDMEDGWNEIKSDLKSLSPELCETIDEFLLGTNDSKNVIGFSTEDIKNKLILGNTKPDLISELENSIKLFKRSILVKNDEGLTLLDLFARVLDKSQLDLDIDLENIEDFKSRFYTDVRKLEDAIELILKDIYKINTKSKIKVLADNDDDFITLKIIDVGSVFNDNSKMLIETIGKTGNFSSIHKLLKSICHWDVETQCKDGLKTIHYLYPERDGTTPYIDPKTNELEGFTHILRFYK